MSDLQKASCVSGPKIGACLLPDRKALPYFLPLGEAPPSASPPLRQQRTHLEAAADRQEAPQAAAPSPGSVAMAMSL